MQVTSAFIVSNTLNGRDQLRVFIKPDENVNGDDLQLSFDVSRSRRFDPSVITVPRDFDIVASEDSPIGLTISNSIADESDSTLQIGSVSDSDPDNYPALDNQLF